MIHGYARSLMPAAGLTLLLALSGCATAPATGERIFTAGLSESQEAALGKEQHPKVLAAFGGEYDDPDLARYIQNIGDLLAQTSERPDVNFTFTVLDSPIVNAFALPGGYVYVTRGLLALANTEAEVAGVLAHEIGHITARHTAERYGSQVAATALNIGLALLLGGGPATQAAGTVSAAVLQSFSRDQEFEADVLGVRYLSRAGYNPSAMAAFLEQLLEDSRLQAQLIGDPDRADDFNIMQTHPRTVDRIERAIAEAGTKPVADPIRAKEIYLGKVDGILYGDSPAQGFIRERSFLHPKLRFAFEVPEGFRLFNSASQVIARGPGNALIVFDQEANPPPASVMAYLTQGWGRQLRLADVEAFDVNGMEAATGWTRVNTQRGPVDLRLVVVRYDRNTIYRFLFVTPPALTEELSYGFKQTTYSFRRLSAQEAAALKPLRLDIYTVKPGDTVTSLAARMPFPDLRERRFRVLNGLAPEAGLQPGQKVKVVTAELGSV